MLRLAREAAASGKASVEYLRIEEREDGIHHGEALAIDNRWRLAALL